MTTLPLSMGTFHSVSIPLKLEAQLSHWSSNSPKDSYVSLEFQTLVAIVPAHGGNFVQYSYSKSRVAPPAAAVRILWALFWNKCKRKKAPVPAFEHLTQSW